MAAGENSLSICQAMIRFVLTGYHNLISPFLPRACRFFPSCSVYATQAIQKHGILRGLWLGLRRVSRCQPWNPGGYDPVQ
jgi:putative membrane protein insertion efficiency factor